MRQISQSPVRREAKYRVRPSGAKVAKRSFERSMYTGPSGDLVKTYAVPSGVDVTSGSRPMLGTARLRRV